MTREELLNDTWTLQRVLKTDHLYTGKIDGISGPLTRSAVQTWSTRHAEAAARFPVSERSEKNLLPCTSTLALAVRQWLTERVVPWCDRQGLTVHIIQGLRSVAEQNALSTSVTKATGGKSYHNYGAAVDLGLFRGKTYLEGDSEYRALYAACGVPDGCLWGGTWRSMPDTPHYQLAEWGSTISPLLRYLNS